ncbi:NAD(+) diphosphatase [Trueperella bialowiezensis]|uniref:NAD(+) diphosphatase n=1 Tax=Trueperella bialowiezensis TaxID=312285 RepID=A0A3S5EW51_9ACTO|nr:NAD(+) diphosphatase [Trueperella bialowiezensis]VEI13791.1 NADH pyrophosphatase [Trueperella bialowiezensis]
MHGKLTAASTVFDRDAATRLNPYEALADPAGRYLLVSGDSVAVRGKVLDLWTREQAAALGDVGPVYLGKIGKVPHFAIDVAPLIVDDEWSKQLAAVTFEGFYGVGALLPAEQASLAMAAIALLNWQARAKFCPTCGTPTQLEASGWQQRCANNHMVFPRMDPAVIMAIHDGHGRILLGRNRAWPEGRFSTLAGFVEAGETVEDAVRREVFEEVQIRVGRLRYFASQPWPFPRSLMFGFHGWLANESQQIQVDGVEVVDARWFTRDAVHAIFTENPQRLPSPASIAHALITDWYGGPLSEPPVAGNSELPVAGQHVGGQA